MWYLRWPPVSPFLTYMIPLPFSASSHAKGCFWRPLFRTHYPVFNTQCGLLKNLSCVQSRDEWNRTTVQEAERCSVSRTCSFRWNVYMRLWERAGWRASCRKRSCRCPTQKRITRYPSSCDSTQRGQHRLCLPKRCTTCCTGLLRKAVCWGEATRAGKAGCR